MDLTPTTTKWKFLEADNRNVRICFHFEMFKPPWNVILFWSWTRGSCWLNWSDFISFTVNTNLAFFTVLLFCFLDRYGVNMSLLSSPMLKLWVVILQWNSAVLGWTKIIKMCVLNLNKDRHGSENKHYFRVTEKVLLYWYIVAYHMYLLDQCPLLELVDEYFFYPCSLSSFYFS